MTAGVCLPRRNCRGNPNCLVGIGEHVWLGEIDENSFHNIDDPNCERRKKVPPNPPQGPAGVLGTRGGDLSWPFLPAQNAFVGLTNLGATCYVNTFLQMWFLNLELRQALYLCPSACGDGLPKDTGVWGRGLCSFPPKAARRDKVCQESSWVRLQPYVLLLHC